VTRIAELEPDVVVVNGEENRRIDVERLRAADIAVYVTDPRSLAEAAVTVEGVASLVGAEGRGRGVADAIRRAQEAVRAASPARPVRAVCAIWRDPWMVVGAGTVAGDVLAHAGFTLVAPGPRYPAVTLEQITEDDPDVVLLPDEPYAFGEDDRSALDHLRARTRLIDGTSLTWYGPRTPYALRELNRLARSLARGR
jgi:ABC-type Fe3+-hydroxamate transport system substrate-binding protein